MHFIGVDLAWSPRRTSAVSVAAGDEHQASLSSWRSDVRGLDELMDFIDEATQESSKLLAIDAPLVVPNLNGMRACDRAATSLFRNYKAGVHPVNRSNLARYDGFQGERLARKLTGRGYHHATAPQHRESMSGFFETYPHAAAVVLFGLSERLPYKARGSTRPWGVRRDAFREYQSHLRSLVGARPAMAVREDLLQIELDEMEEVQRKQYEDLLDSITCAYVSYYYWYWGTSKCTILGSLEEGYMILPNFPLKVQPDGGSFEAWRGRPSPLIAGPGKLPFRRGAPPAAGRSLEASERSP